MGSWLVQFQLTCYALAFHERTANTANILSLFTVLLISIEISFLMVNISIKGKSYSKTSRKSNYHSLNLVKASFRQSIAHAQQVWCSSESARLPPIWPGFDFRSRCHMLVEFVVGSRPCFERFYFGYSGFPLSSKTNISKFQFDPEPEGHRFVSPRLLGVTLVKQSCLFIYLYTLHIFTNGGRAEKSLVPNTETRRFRIHKKNNFTANVCKLHRN